MPRCPDHQPAEREDGVGGSGYQPRGSAPEPPAEEVHHDGGREIGEQQAEVNAHVGLAEERHNEGVNGTGAGELHAVGQLVGGNAFEDELAHVGKLAFISFKGHSEQANSDDDCEQDDTRRQDPR